LGGIPLYPLSEHKFTRSASAEFDVVSVLSSLQTNYLLSTSLSSGSLSAGNFDDINIRKNAPTLSLVEQLPAPSTTGIVVNYTYYDTA